MSTQPTPEPSALNWKQVVELARTGNTPPPRRVEKSDSEWRKLLSDEQYHVARSKGTERPFSSQMCALFDPGRYHCVCCDTPLFDSTSKFDSGTGWPSFDQAVEGAVATTVDRSHGMTRIEVHCSRCGGHLGHLFDDGPTSTGQRYCMNGVAMTFEPKA